MKVTLRKRLKSGKVSLFLEYYQNNKRSYEYLGLHLMPEPKFGKLTKQQKEDNKKNLALAEAIRSKRHLEIQNGIYGFRDQGKIKGSFVQYFETLAKARLNSLGNYGNWDSTLKHLKAFVKTDVTFEEIDKAWLEAFSKYLQNEAKTSAGATLKSASSSSYFAKVRAALKQAVKDKIINYNPSEEVQCIRVEEEQREFLTQEELQAMADAVCNIPVLKRAFLFSAMSGLRWSDTEGLEWWQVQHTGELGDFIRFKQQKTKGNETLPISETARQLIGEQGDRSNTDKVFQGLKYSSWYNIKLQQWALRAGVTKTITFHCARHTYATLLLTNNTDIYTVSKMLGHKHLKTTEIYGRVINKKKQEAANLLKLNVA